MSFKPRIVALAGSTRPASYNQALVRVAAAGAAAAGAEVTIIALADYPMPLYHQPLEAESGLPEHAARLRELFLAHHGILLASPEYNGSLTAVLKNTLDWLSRAQPDGRSPFTNKVAAIMSASPGALGGLRGLVHARSVLNNLGVLVLPRQVAVPAAAHAFGADGELVDEKRAVAVRALGEQLAQTTAALAVADEGGVA